MKVLCIDNSDGPFKVASILLVEGNIYTVTGTEGESYFLAEIKINPKTGNKITFGKRRFIPISNIDEKELIKERELSIESN